MIEDIIIKLTLSIVVVLSAIYVGLCLKGVDRKLAARMQGRIGPPLRQPFWDVSKLFQKENIVPHHAVEWIFNLMPLVALASAMVIMLYLPIGPLKPVLGSFGDLILVIYLFAFPGLALAIGGFSSGSPVAAIGAQREMVVMMSYELPIALVIFGRAMLLASNGLDGFSLKFATDAWALAGITGIIGLGLLLLALMMVIPGELAKIPFDQPEAETELAGGVEAEYSGRNMAMFYLADAVKSLALATLVVALFFPWGISQHMAWLPEVGGYAVGAWIVDGAFFLLKVFLILLVSVTFVRVAMPRLRIDRASSFYIFTTGGIAAVGLPLLYIDIYIGGL
jgi:formate hydrogenlyase subunit 4